MSCQARHSVTTEHSAHRHRTDRQSLQQQQQQQQQQPATTPSSVLENILSINRLATVFNILIGMLECLCRSNIESLICVETTAVTTEKFQNIVLIL